MTVHDGENDILRKAIPALRSDLEAIPWRQGGEDLIVLRDPSGYSKEMLHLSPQAWALIVLFDGTMPALAVSEVIEREVRIRVPAQQIVEMAAVLDTALFLDSPAFAKARAANDACFMDLQIRPAAHAGQSYSADPAELSDFFSRLLPREGSGIRGNPPSGILVPHIDLKIGPDVYAPAFERMRRYIPETVVILGTSHYSNEDLFILTEKNFETPFGVLPADVEFVRQLRRASGDSFTHRDVAHRQEHSIEFPVLFLQHLYGSRAPRIVAVLCTSFDHYLAGGGPRSDERYRIFIDAFRETIDTLGREVSYVVSVDWSHVGRKFGDGADAAALLPSVRLSDRALLEAVQRVDHAAFTSLLAETGNATRLDGYSCISTFFDLALPRRAELLAYDAWHEEERASAVTYASMAFYDA